MIKRLFKAWIAPLLLLAIAACDVSTQNSSDNTSSGIDPAGQYQIAGNTVSKTRSYTGQLTIERRGAAYSLAWRLDAGDAYGGTAILADNVLGAVYWPGSGKPGGDLGIVVYKINGGELTGTWIPAGATADKLGRETLKGRAGLDGRYEVTLGENPGGRGSYTGYVEMARHGDTYELRWFVPTFAYMGQGLRVGDVLVVGYSGGKAPGVIAYCMTADGGQGIWSYGDAKSLGTETISRSAEAASRLAAQPSECAATGT